jgi:hypothetical protein
MTALAASTANVGAHQLVKTTSEGSLIDGALTF